MKPLTKDCNGYTLVESLVAIVLFVTVVLEALDSMSGFMVSPRTRLLQAASIAAQDELVRLRADALFTEKTIRDNLIIQRDVTQRGRYAEVTLSIAPVNEEEKHLVVITKLVLLQHEE